jgi:hypothetical protein
LNDIADLSFTTALPKISTGFFDIKCHIGVIIIDDHVCADTSLTLEQKLLKGMIFEHSGPDMKRSIDGQGRRANTRFAKIITALEFIGYTEMGNADLDDLCEYSTYVDFALGHTSNIGHLLVQNIIRVDAALDKKPRYRPIYWNCHDIAVRFAFLATAGYASFELAKMLSKLFERTKFNFQKTSNILIPHASSFAFDTAFGLAGVAFPPLGTVTLAQKVIRNGTIIAQQQIMTYSALMDRKSWVDTLEQRFPRLLGLGIDEEQWQKLVDSVSIIPALERRGLVPGIFTFWLDIARLRDQGGFAHA